MARAKLSRKGEADTFEAMDKFSLLNIDKTD